MEKILLSLFDIEIINKANNLQISLLKLPSSCSSILQPLDCCHIFKSFKEDARNEFNRYDNQNSSDKNINLEIISANSYAINEFPIESQRNHFLKSIYSILTSCANNRFGRGFRNTGLFPFNVEKILTTAFQKNLVFNYNEISKLNSLMAEFYYFGHTPECIFNALGYRIYNKANKTGALQYHRLVNIFSQECLVFFKQKYETKLNLRNRDYIKLILTEKNDFYFTVPNH